MQELVSILSLHPKTQLKTEYTLKSFLFTLFLGSLFFVSCNKDSVSPPIAPETAVTCRMQTDNPSGRSYTSSSLVSFTCTEKHCGMMPLHNRNYWVYEDSLFDNGVFQRVQYDTLRFVSNKQTLTDGLVWWESNISVGLPALLYSNDSSFFTLADRMFVPGIRDAKKEFSLFAGDSVRYLSSFEDVAASGRSVKLTSPLVTPFGSFSNCIFFEKNARNYRKEQVYFKQGLGVVKFIQEKAQPGSPLVKLAQVSTLISVHIE